MMEWTRVGESERLKMLVSHDDAAREYAYGPASGLPDTKVGAFSRSLMAEAKDRGWTVISMKTDWKCIFLGAVVRIEARGSAAAGKAAEQLPRYPGAGAAASMLRA